MQRSNLRQVNSKPKMIKPSFKLGLRVKADQPVKPIARLKQPMKQLQIKVKPNFNTIGASRMNEPEMGDLHSDEEGTAAQFNK